MDGHSVGNEATVRFNMTNISKTAFQAADQLFVCHGLTPNYIMSNRNIKKEFEKKNSYS